MAATDQTGEPSAGDDGNPVARARPLAPAVARAVRIISYLGETEDGASVSDIARALSINKSTCFNILTTLVENQVLSKHPRFHIYRLGPRLVEWGRASRTQFAVRSGLREALAEFAEELSTAVLVGQVLGDSRGVVVFDRMIPPRPGAIAPQHGEVFPGVMTPQIGEVFPLSNPAMGRLVLAAYEDEHEAERAARQVGLLPVDAEADGFLETLAAIRRQGYSAAAGKGQPRVNAVATSLSPRGAEVVTLLCAMGYPDDLPEDRFEAVGLRVMGFAQELLSRPSTAEAVMAWAVGGAGGTRYTEG
jgi:IclR family transcriptional regulator, KDG regulon repressor